MHEHWAPVTCTGAAGVPCGGTFVPCYPERCVHPSIAWTFVLMTTAAVFVGLVLLLLAVAHVRRRYARPGDPASAAVGTP